MTVPALIQRLRDADVAMLYDDVQNQYWELLRSLPAIHYAGYSTFTYPTSWRTLNTGGQFESYSEQYDYLDYQYLVMGEIEETEYTGDLVVTTNDYYETQTQYPIDHLISRYSARPETLVVVTASKDFTPRGGQRPLYQEQFVEALGSCRRLYDAWDSVYEDAGWTLPLTDTMNLFLHDNANVYNHVTGSSVTTTDALFEVLPDAPYLPLYDVFSDIFAREEQLGVSPLGPDDITGLQRWFQRRIEWDQGKAKDISRRLNNRVSNDGSTFDPAHAQRLEAREARKAAKQLQPKESSIDKRYESWLQRQHL